MKCTASTQDVLQRFGLDGGSPHISDWLYDVNTLGRKRPGRDILLEMMLVFPQSIVIYYLMRKLKDVVLRHGWAEN